jgi:hypothetical protein
LSKDEDDYLAIKNEPIDKLDPSKLSSVKKEIEYFNLWYLIECCHCGTLFLVEDSIDNIVGVRKDSGNVSFNAYCPRCKTRNKVKATGRLKLRFKRKAKDGEFDSYTTRASKKMELPKSVEEKMRETRDIELFEKHNKDK